MSSRGSGRSRVTRWGAFFEKGKKAILSRFFFHSLFSISPFPFASPPSLSPSLPSLPCTLSPQLSVAMSAFTRLTLAPSSRPTVAARPTFASRRTRPTNVAALPPSSRNDSTTQSSGSPLTSLQVSSGEERDAVALVPTRGAFLRSEVERQSIGCPRKKFSMVRSMHSPLALSFLEALPRAPTKAAAAATPKRLLSRGRSRRTRRGGARSGEVHSAIVFLLLLPFLRIRRLFGFSFLDLHLDPPVAPSPSLFLRPPPRSPHPTPPTPPPPRKTQRESKKNRSASRATISSLRGWERSR